MIACRTTRNNEHLQEEIDLNQSEHSLILSAYLLRTMNRKAFPSAAANDKDGWMQIHIYIVYG